MQTGIATIKDIFAEAQIFSVPIYQRAYAWDINNLEDFWSDIFNQYPDRQYFFGTFLFHKKEDRGEFTIIDVVDGQQRLTTFVIFIHMLIKKLRATQSTSEITDRTSRIFVKDGDVFKIETTNDDSAFLHSILSDEKIIKTDTHSQHLLREAKNFFENKINETDQSMLEQMFETSKKAAVLIYVADEINEATQIFELLNDRGKKLTNLESIKSFLMYNIGLISDNPDQIIQDIQINFSEIYRIIEKHAIDEDDVLRYHTIAFERCPADYNDKPKEFIKNKIIKLIKEKNNTVINMMRDYSTALKDSFIVFSKIQEEKETQYELSELFMIGRVALFYPVLMRFYDNKSKFKELIPLIKRFTLQASLAHLRADTGESKVYTALRNNEDIAICIEEFTQYNWWGINDRALDVIRYENYYEWLNRNLVKYILFSYENKLRKKKGFSLLGWKEYSSSDKRDKLSIEHINAQRSKRKKFNQEFQKEYEHSIGNLVIDCVAPNSSKGNKDVKDKLSHYQEAPLMSQNEIDRCECDWKSVNAIKKFIKTREKRLQAFVKEYTQLI